MLMESSYQYRILQHTWGIAIDISAEATSLVSESNGIARVTDDLWLKVVPTFINEEEYKYLAIGLSTVVNKIRAKKETPVPVLVQVTRLEFNECDYQPVIAFTTLPLPKNLLQSLFHCLHIFLFPLT
jgi:hypothetical protein